MKNKNKNKINFKKGYKICPDELELRESKIHGIGVFAKVKIKKDRIFDKPTHRLLKEFNETERLNFGGAINHSYKPNCKLIRTDTYQYLCSIKNIQADEEITLDYRDCDCGKDY